MSGGTNNKVSVYHQVLLPPCGQYQMLVDQVSIHGKIAHFKFVLITYILLLH